MRNHGYKVPTLFALLWSVYFINCNPSSPEVIWNGTMRMVFPGDQLDRFYDCLCNSTSTSCTVRYSRNESTFSVTGTIQTRTTTNVVLIGQHEIAYNCYLNPNEVSANTNFTCSRIGQTSDTNKLGDGVFIEGPILRTACGNDRFVTVLWTSTVNITVSNWSANIPIMNEDGSNGTTTMTQRMVTTAMPTSVSSSSNSMVTASTRIPRISNNDIPITTKQNGVADTSTGRFTTTTQDSDTSTSSTTSLTSSTKNISASTSNIISTRSTPKRNTITGKSITTTKNKDLAKTVAFYTTTVDLSSLSYNITQNTAAYDSTTTASPHVIAGTFSGLALLIAIIIALVVIWRRRKAKRAKELKANRPNISIPFQHSKEPALTTQSSPIPVANKDLVKSCDLKSQSLNKTAGSSSRKKGSSNEYEYCFGEDEHAIVSDNILADAHLATSSNQSKSGQGANKDNNINYSTVYSTVSDPTNGPPSKEQTTPTLTASVNEEIEYSVVDMSKKTRPNKKPRFNIVNDFKEPNTSDFKEATDTTDAGYTNVPVGSEYTEVGNPRPTTQNIYTRLGEQIRDMKNPYNFL